MPQPTNPYIAGSSLHDKGFFDRQDILDWVAQELRNPGTNSIVLFGQRRIGKTSLLLKLRSTLPGDEFLPVFFDLQLHARNPLRNILTALSRTMANAAGMSGPLVKMDVLGQSFRDDFLPAFLAKAGPARPVLLLDEFDWLEDAPGSAVAAVPAEARGFLSFLMQLMADFPKLAFVFAAGRNPSELLMDLKSTFKASLAREVWVLDRAPTQILVQQAQMDGSLDFSEAAIERILALTSCHPYLTQLLCQRIWEWAHARKVEGIPHIDETDVDLAVGDALSAANAALQWMWDGLSLTERVYAAALAKSSEENHPIPEDKAIALLSASGNRLRDHEIERAPANLVRRRILREAGERHYIFAVELLRKWIVMSQPLNETKGDLDREDPIADLLYHAGAAFFDQRNWQNAHDSFVSAIAANPRHVAAQLGLGEALLKLERIPEAIEALQKAWYLDRDDARLPLARAWVAQAELLQNKGQMSTALDACDQALKLSPTEQGALTIKTAIWNQQGDEAANRGDLELAISAYERAGNTEQAKLLHERQEEDENLAARFREGYGAYRKGEWEKAKLAFLWIVNVRPEYERGGQKAAHLLARAIDDGHKPPPQFMVWLRQPPARIILGLCVIILVFVISAGLSFGAKLGDRGAGTVNDAQATPTPSPTGTTAPIRPPYLFPTATSRPADSPTLIPISMNNVPQLTVLERFTVGKLNTNPLHVLAFSSNGRMIASGSQDGEVYLWDTETDEKNLLKNLHYPVFSLAFSLNAETLVTGDGADLTWWDLEHGGQTSFNRSVDSDQVVHALALSSNGTTLVAAAGPELIWWDARTATRLFSRNGHLAAVVALAFSPNDQTLASGSDDNTIILWDRVSGQPIRTLPGHRGSVRSVAFSPDGSLLASGSDDHTIILWDVAAATQRYWLHGHQVGAIHSVAFSPDGRILASGSADGTIAFWDVANGLFISKMTRQPSILSLAFSPDGSLFASGGSNGQITIWSLAANATRYSFSFASGKAALTTTLTPTPTP